MPIGNRLAQAFGSKLGVIVEELDTPPATDLLQVAGQLQDVINQHKRSMGEAEGKLNEIIDQLNAKLGYEIIQKQRLLKGNKGELKVSHHGGNCNAGYFSKVLSFRPDLTSKCWRVDGSDAWPRHFRREYPHALRLTASPDLLADTVVKFFANRFRSLGGQQR